MSRDPSGKQPSLWFTRPGRIALLATVIAAAPFLLFGTVQLIRTDSWVSQRLEAPGTVREIVRDAGTRRWYVVVDYTTAQGQTQPFARWIEDPGDYRTGRIVRVMYREASPEFSARIVTWKGLWFEGVFQIAMALVTLALGLTAFAVTEIRIERRTGGATSAGAAGGDRPPHPPAEPPDEPPARGP